MMRSDQENAANYSLEGQRAKRGRPPLLPPPIYQWLAGEHRGLSHRQRLNWWYAYDAMNAIKDLPCFGYFYDAAQKKAKVGLLTELGRLGHEELIKQMAVELSEYAERRAISVKDAEKLMRRYRLQLKQEGGI